MGIVSQSCSIRAEGPLEPNLAAVPLPPECVALAELPGPGSSATPMWCLYGTLSRAVVRGVCVSHACKVWTRCVHVCASP